MAQPGSSWSSERKTRDYTEKLERLLQSFAERGTAESKACSDLTSETLQKLGVDLYDLPRGTRTQIKILSKKINDLGQKKINPKLLFSYKAKAITEKLDDEYTILELKHENIQLQAEIDRNQQYIDQLKLDLKKDLADVKLELEVHLKNNIMRLTKRNEEYKAALENAERGISDLNILPEFPIQSIMEDIAYLDHLRRKEAEYKAKADIGLACSIAVEETRKLSEHLNLTE